MKLDRQALLKETEQICAEIKERKAHEKLHGPRISNLSDGLKRAALRGQTSRVTRDALEFEMETGEEL